jgi:hypothetical protein
MKLYEVLEPVELDESALKKAALAAAAGASLMGAPKGASPTASGIEVTPFPKASTTHQPQTLSRADVDQRIDALYGDESHLQTLSKSIAREYRIKPELAETIVRLAHRHEKPDFPTAADILAVIAVESSFNPNAVSRLRKDPARGLMQVRPGIWNVDPAKLQKDLDKQIRVGSNILHRYYQRFGDRDAALHAYNMGPTNVRRGKLNPRYVGKVNDKYQQYLSQ